MDLMLVVECEGVLSLIFILILIVLLTALNLKFLLNR